MTNTDRPPLAEGRAFAFGNYVLDPVRRLLWCDGRVVPITDKALDVLITLVAHHDRALQKEELLKRIWPGTFVQENNLVRHVSMVRRALGQSPEQHDYVVTLPGHGYRFVAAVREIDTPIDFPTSTIADQKADVAVPAQFEAVESPAHAARSGVVARDAESGPLNPSIPDAGAPDVATEEHPTFVPPSAPAPAPAPARSRTRRRLQYLTAAVVVGGVALAAVNLWSRSTESARPRTLRQITYGPYVQIGPTWSPDGRALAFSSNRSGDFEIWVQALDQPEPVRITWSPGADWQPSWSPDGRLLAFRSEGPSGGGVYVITPRGEGLRQISRFGYHPTWSPDSASVLFESSQVERLRPQPYIAKLDGSAPQPARSDLTQGWTQVRAAWHADSQLTLWGRDANGAWTMIKAPISGGEVTRYSVPRQLVEQLDDLNLTLKNFVWAPSGQFLYFEGISMQVRNLWRVRVNQATLAWLAAPERLTLGEGADSDLSLSRDGKTIAFTVVKERTRLWALPLNGSRDGKGEQALTSGGAGEFDAAVSADGRVLVYRTVRAGRQELWARSIPDKTDRLLISGTEWVRSSPRLSTDGTRVAYRLIPTSSQHSKPAVAILEPNGAEVVVSASGVQPFTPDDWSADDSTILGGCTAADSTQFGICTISAQPNSQPKFVVRDPNREFFSPHYSPNQRWISVVERTVPRRPDWNGAISVFSVSGGSRVAITDGKWNDEKPRWSADGKALYFVSNRGGFLNLWGRRFNPERGVPEGDIFQVTRFNDPTRMVPTDMGQVETSVSGDRVFLPLTEMSSTIWSLEGVDR